MLLMEVPQGDGRRKFFIELSCGISMATQEEYAEYIESEEWAEKSIGFINKIGQCEKCFSKASLECHHLTYNNLGKEIKEDIEVLCYQCHREKHKHDEYKKKLFKRFVGGQDISMNEIREQETELKEFEESDPDGFLEAYRHRKRRVNWKP